MKNLTGLLIVLTIMGSFPIFAKANTNLMENIISTNTANYSGYNHRLFGGYSQTFDQFLNRGHVDVLVTGDGSTDLDLYVYAGGILIGKSDGYSDDEKVCLTITRSGYFQIVVVNRGRYTNDYQLKIK